MFRVFVLVALALALQPRFHSSVEPLPAAARHAIRATAWDPGCPLPLARLRVLTVSYWGFDRRAHVGQLAVNEDAAGPLAKVFRRLFELRFPIHHLGLADAYGSSRAVPRDGDISGSFDCKQAIPSPCEGGTGTGSWSEHAYGEAVDLNPIENPYLGCGRVHDRRSRPYADRSRPRRGMVTPAVIRAFRSIGWGWGGSWPGATKDYTHFSVSGH